VSPEPPPSIAILLDELGDFSRSDEQLRRLMNDHDLRAELRRQSEYSLEHWQYPDDATCSSIGLALCPSGLVDPFDGTGKCHDLRCCAAIARRFATTVGLYAETILLTDPLSLALADSTDTEQQQHELFRRIRVLHELAPLVRAGVVRFSRPIMPYCATCKASIQDLHDRIEPQVAELLMDSVAFQALQHEEHRGVLLEFALGHERQEAAFFLSEENYSLLRKSSQPLRPNSQERQAISSAVRSHAAGLVHAALASISRARRVRGTVAAGDALEVQCLRTLYGERPGRPTIERIGGTQGADLPWISDLTPAEVISLRDAAATALPRFREFVLSTIENATSHEDIEKKLGELRANATEVEAELQAIRKGKLVRAGVVGTSIGLSICLFAVATAPAVAVAALAAALAALAGTHQHVVKDVVDEAKLCSLPSYVLVKARDLLKHGDHS
jgi:hypothetical protein